jgi:hypothetical protein
MARGAIHSLIWRCGHGLGEIVSAGTRAGRRSVIYPSYFANAESFLPGHLFGTRSEH